MSRMQKLKGLPAAPLRLKKTHNDTSKILCLQHKTLIICNLYYFQADRASVYGH